MSMTGSDVVVAPVTVNKPSTGYVQWGAIFAGAIIATAISTIFTVFGSALGLSMISADFSRSSSGTALAIALALWTLWVTVSASMAGGYLAGRMTQPVLDSTADERKVRDGAHGLVVWATGMLIVVFITTSSLFGAAKTAVNGVASAGSGVASLVSSQADQMGLALDNVTRASGQAPVTAEERDQASRIFVNSLANGRLEQGDRDYLASRLAARANISEQDAQKRIDDAYAKLNQAKETAKQAAEKARKIAILAAFLTAAGLLVAAVSAWWAAGMGGEHRDEAMRRDPIV